MFKHLRRQTTREKMAEESRDQQRIPVYRQAIIRMCQLQMKICIKFFDLRRQPKTLKDIAKINITRPLGHSLKRDVAVDQLREHLPAHLIVMRAAIFVLTVLVTIAFAQNAQNEKKPASNVNVRCYQCNSLTPGQEKCASGDENDLKPFLKPCQKITSGNMTGESANSCRKILQEVHEQEGVIRECAYTGHEPVDGKRRIGNKGIILYLYQCFNENETINPCNSATSHSTIVALCFALTSSLLFFRS